MLPVTGTDDATGDLFKRERARNTDPWTSHAAADGVEEFSDRHYAVIAIGLGQGGRTAHEIAAIIGFEYAQVHKRLPEMARMSPPLAMLDRDASGDVKTKLGPKGRQCRLWKKPA